MCKFRRKVGVTKNAIWSTCVLGEFWKNPMGISFSLLLLIEEIDIKYINLGQVLKKLQVFKFIVLNLKNSGKSVNCNFISLV